MRSYGQFCPIARSLDQVGDRWVLLIIRELLIRPCRFSDLRAGLTGIASNLLTERLRSLEESGIIERAELPPPAASSIYRLTDRGHDLLPVVVALARWGGPLLATGQGDDRFAGRWLIMLATGVLRDVPASDLGPLVVEFRVDREPIVIDVSQAGVTVEIGPGTHPDVIVRADPMTAFDLLGGTIDLAAARRRSSVEVTGERDALTRFETLCGRMTPLHQRASDTAVRPG
ncbi:MAG: Transcriptional regulator, HxlR family [uncultured Thermomicrobiales bacterium]|uniref:Transcriptional regulator, HxlR family n=1 Tax=uncultured Thermomicrobiales bacterium TaxID=1645740 RepID=A0A6J4VAB9_9BACT|nr:MAG: Transcriptional regulator, HxlR family [uncultured Thermomicrobiales bacterium]